jgi:hypothetical protein
MLVRKCLEIKTTSGERSAARCSNSELRTRGSHDGAAQI